MADDWVFEILKVAKSYRACLKALGTTQRGVEKLVKTHPRQAEAVKKKVHACLLEKHPFLRGPRYFAPAIVRKTRS